MTQHPDQWTRQSRAIFRAWPGWIAHYCPPDVGLRQELGIEDVGLEKHYVLILSEGSLRDDCKGASGDWYQCLIISTHPLNKTRSLHIWDKGNHDFNPFELCLFVVACNQSGQWAYNKWHENGAVQLTQPHYLPAQFLQHTSRRSNNPQIWGEKLCNQSYDLMAALAKLGALSSGEESLTEILSNLGRDQWRSFIPRTLAEGALFPAVQRDRPSPVPRNTEFNDVNNPNVKVTLETDRYGLGQ